MPRDRTYTGKPPMNQAEFITIYNNLGNKCRQVLQQKLLGKTDKEILEILGIKSEATVRQHLSKALDSATTTNVGNGQICNHYFFNSCRNYSRRNLHTDNH
jgi:FixJ family two-component response regulator